MRWGNCVRRVRLGGDADTHPLAKRRANMVNYGTSTSMALRSREARDTRVQIVAAILVGFVLRSYLS